MKTAGVILFAICALILLALGAMFFYLYRVFEKRPEKLGKTIARSVNARHRENVRIYQMSYHGPLKTITVKDQSKMIYLYEAEGKKYRIRYTEYKKLSMVPPVVQVCYLKTAPRIAFVKTETNSCDFDIYSLAFFGLSLLFAILALSLIFI